MEENTTQTTSPETPTTEEAPAAPTPEESAVPEMVVEGAEEVQPETLYADKFKSVSELEKSYKELQSTFSKKMGAFTGAPEEGYNIDSEFLESLPGEERALVSAIQDWGKENQLSDEGLGKLLETYSNTMQQARAEQIKAEVAKLGEGAEQRLGEMKNWLVANLGEDGAKAVAPALTTAESVVALEKLIAMTKAPAPANAPAQTVSKEKVEQMRFATNEHGERLMSIDPEYRARVLKLERQLYGE